MKSASDQDLPSVETFIAEVEPAAKQADAEVLDQLFRAVTGWPPRMWTKSMVGYGAYAYRYPSGHSGRCWATGFSPQKAKHAIHIMPGYTDHSAILGRLGKHKLGKACVYINKVADVDMDVLAELIRAGLDDLAKQYSVTPT